MAYHDVGSNINISRALIPGDEKLKLEQENAALKAAVGALESELRAARDALAAATRDAASQDRAHAALQNKLQQLRSDFELAQGEERRERARGDSEHARAERAERMLNGEVGQVDPIKPKLKAPGTKRLKLKYDEPISNFAFKFKLRRCNEVAQRLAAAEREAEQARGAAEALAQQRDDAREDADSSRRRAADEAAAALRAAAVAAAAAEAAKDLAAAELERDIARQAAAEAAAALWGNGSSALEMLDTMEARVARMGQGLTYRVAAAEAAAAATHTEFSESGAETAGPSRYCPQSH